MVSVRRRGFAGCIARPIVESVDAILEPRPCFTPLPLALPLALPRRCAPRMKLPRRPPVWLSRRPVWLSRRVRLARRVWLPRLSEADNDADSSCKGCAPEADVLSTAAGAAAAAPAAGERAVLLDAGAYFFALLPDGAGVGATFATLVLLGIRRFARLTRARWSEIRVHRTRTALKRRRPGLCVSRPSAHKKTKKLGAMLRRLKGPAGGRESLRVRRPSLYAGEARLPSVAKLLYPTHDL